MSALVDELTVGTRFQRYEVAAAVEVLERLKIPEVDIRILMVQWSGMGCVDPIEMAVAMHQVWHGKRLDLPGTAAGTDAAGPA